MTTIADVHAGERIDTEALFREARRRRRRRRMIGMAAAIGAVAAGAALFAATRSSPAKRAVKPSAQSPRAQTVVPVARVVPQHPYNLAVGPTGTLYFVDAGRDQVLKLGADGRFAIVAGTGRAGWSGDGGPARKAALRLQYYSGITVSEDGTLYIADSGNRRVRAVLPDGTIRTVAGNGKDGMVLDDEPALEGAIGSVTGLALGPNGDLYIASGSVMRRTPQGMLDWVAGAPLHRGLPGCGGIDCNPAGEGDFSEPDQLAFDGAGDLFVSDGNGFGLYEIAANGALRYLGQFRGDGAPGALAPMPDGNLLAAWRPGLSVLDPSTATASVPLSIEASRDLPYATKLDAALAQGTQRNHFIGGDGVAVAPDGDIYVDTNDGNGFSNVSALLRISRAGVVSTIWKS